MSLVASSSFRLEQTDMIDRWAIDDGAQYRWPYAKHWSHKSSPSSTLQECPCTIRIVIARQRGTQNRTLSELGIWKVSSPKSHWITECINHFLLSLPALIQKRPLSFADFTMYRSRLHDQFLLASFARAPPRSTAVMKVDDQGFMNFQILTW